MPDEKWACSTCGYRAARIATLETELRDTSARLERQTYELEILKARSVIWEYVIDVLERAGFYQRVPVIEDVSAALPDPVSGTVTGSHFSSGRAERGRGLTSDELTWLRNRKEGMR